MGKELVIMLVNTKGRKKTYEESASSNFIGT